MNKIAEYLKDNPNYYIEGGEKIINDLNEVKSKVNNIIDITKLFLVKYDNTNMGMPCIKIEKDGDEIGYISYFLDSDNEYMRMHFAKINDGNNKYNNFNNYKNFQGKGYGKILYILVALEALKRGKIFVSDYRDDIKTNAKNTWNTLVNLGIAEYDEDMKRFKFINNMLEDYFIIN